MALLNPLEFDLNYALVVLFASLAGMKFVFLRLMTKNQKEIIRIKKDSSLEFKRKFVLYSIVAYLIPFLSFIAFAYLVEMSDLVWGFVQIMLFMTLAFILMLIVIRVFVLGKDELEGG